MRQWVLITLLVLVVGDAQSGELNRDQRLILACYQLDVEAVAAACRGGADVNARFGEGDPILFPGHPWVLQDPWSLGWPMMAHRWTPLIAVANASNYPPPPRKIQSTIEDIDWALQQQQRIPPDQIERRQQSAFTITLMLVSHNADIDADDGRGGTALYWAVYTHKLEMAKLLLRFNAKVNTETGIGVYPGGDTPLQRATWSAELMRLLREKGAGAQPQTSGGMTPTDRGRGAGDPAVRGVYENPQPAASGSAAPPRP